VTAQLKPTYTQVKNRFESLRELALKIAHDDLRPVISNKRQQAVLKMKYSLIPLPSIHNENYESGKKRGLSGSHGTGMLCIKSTDHT